MKKLKINALLLTILLWYLLLLGKNTEGYNYCEGEIDDELCGQNHKHFICEIDEAIPKKGELLAHVPFTNKIQRILLERHNEIRNETAIGSIQKNKPTKRHISLENTLANTPSNVNIYNINKRSKRSDGFFNESSYRHNSKPSSKSEFVTEISPLETKVIEDGPDYNQTYISINETNEKLPEEIFLITNTNEESITNNNTKNINSENTTKPKYFRKIINRVRKPGHNDKLIFPKLLPSIKTLPNDSLLETNQNSELRFPEVIRGKQISKETQFDVDGSMDRDRLFFSKFISPHSKNDTDQLISKGLFRDLNDPNQKVKLRFPKVIPLRSTSEEGKQFFKESSIDRIFYPEFISPQSKNNTGKQNTRGLSRDLNDRNQKVKLLFPEVSGKPLRPTSEREKQVPQKTLIVEDSGTDRDRIFFPEFNSRSKNDGYKLTSRGLPKDTRDPSQKSKLRFPEVILSQPTSEQEKQIPKETPNDDDNRDRIFFPEFISTQTENDTDEPITRGLSRDINDADASDNPPLMYAPSSPISARSESDTFIDGSNQIDQENNQDLIIATRMRELIWDNELAYLARKHAGQCNSSPVQCHNTSRFHHTGMNLGVLYSENKLSIESVINRTIENWHLTGNNEGNLKDIAAGTNYYEDAKPFATIIHEYTSHLGCAISYCTNCEIQQESEKQKHCYFVTCLYDMTYMPQRPAYKFGNQTSDVASECEDWSSGKSSNYKNLCYNNGKIFPII